MIAHFFNKGIFLRPTGSGSLWKQAVGATRWRNIFFFFLKKLGVSMSFAKVEIYIDAIAGPWLLPPTFIPRWYMNAAKHLILTSLSTSCSGGYIEGCSHFPFFPQHPHVPFPGAEHFTISPIWSGHVSSLPGLQKDFFKDFRSLYSIYIWMHVISAWLFSVSISRLTLGKRCSTVHVIISDRKRILSPEEIEYCLIL